MQSQVPIYGFCNLSSNGVEQKKREPMRETRSPRISNAVRMSAVRTEMASLVINSPDFLGEAMDGEGKLLMCIKLEFQRELSFTRLPDI